MNSRAHDASVVHGHMEGAEVFDDGLTHSLDGRGIPHVGDNRMNVRAVGLQTSSVRRRDRPHRGRP